MSELIVGIDLGTTNSELAVLRDDGVEVLPIHGSPIMPSCVGLDAEDRLIVGQAARNQLIAAPDRTIVSIKRRMGEDTKVLLGTREHTPEEISSFILRELKREGERQLGQPIRKAVITVPAFFNERQRRATQVAGDLAGLEVLRIVHEPTAAALAYGAGVTDGERLLVYDLGGGTFDVSVVVAEAGVVEVKSSHGDTRLGGDDFDQILVDYATGRFEERHGVDLRQNPSAQRRLRVVMERAKRVLSDEPFVMIREEYLDGTHHLEMELLRNEYERLIEPLLEKTLACLHRALNDAKLGPKDIQKVMMVGGATRTPLIRRLLESRFGLDPRVEINPDLIVAMGAAIQAGVIAGHRRHSILVDITPHTYSTAALSDRGIREERICVPIIPRNTPLPASKSELMYTVMDDQPSVNVEAYQGEGEYPGDNTLVGEFRIEGLSAVPAGNPILVHFDLDLNGILKVTATEKDTGLARSVALDTRGQHHVDVEEARRNIAALVGTTAESGGGMDIPAGGQNSQGAASRELLATAKDLRKRSEALLEKGVAAEDATEIRELVHQSAHAITEGNWEALRTHNDALSDVLFYLED
ncbi:MAG: Hsp70 family protein [Verrucomicrobiae bacterium]|nr:Hsp70 family protein [Verrucomicrobiae bacterium]